MAVTGSTGLIGTALVSALRADGHRVLRLVRSRPAPGSDEVYWRPSAGEVDAAALEGVDAVVHLAGENVGQPPWTGERKRRILDSRVQGTGLIARTLAGLAAKPRVLVSASGVNYYGNRGDELLDESSSHGSGFLAEVTGAWEAAADPARAAGIRVVHPRMGVVLGGEGGALEKMSLPFKLGVGGKLGSGRQWMSWVALADVVAAIRFAIGAEGLAGPVNLTSPVPVTNEEFTRVLGRVLGRPTFFTAPGFALKLVLGEMADETLLVSLRAVPKKLQEAGFVFRYPDLEGALRLALEK
ncbi:MAG TPA: TIGR01777 family oxidoreductase [Longimicrobiaceae bacterium]|nr:TIGR01777 family oxidoreductase [Longimicrobiaceae bacterium]